MHTGIDNNLRFICGDSNCRQVNGVRPGQDFLPHVCAACGYRSKIFRQAFIPISQTTSTSQGGYPVQGSYQNTGGQSYAGQSGSHWTSHNYMSSGGGPSVQPMPTSTPSSATGKKRPTPSEDFSGSTSRAEGRNKRRQQGAAQKQVSTESKDKPKDVPAGKAEDIKKGRCFRVHHGSSHDDDRCKKTTAAVVAQICDDLLDTEIAKASDFSSVPEDSVYKPADFEDIMKYLHAINAWLKSYHDYVVKRDRLQLRMITVANELVASATDGSQKLRQEVDRFIDIVKKSNTSLEKLKFAICDGLRRYWRGACTSGLRDEIRKYLPEHVKANASTFNNCQRKELFEIWYPMLCNKRKSENLPASSEADLFNIGRLQDDITEAHSAALGSSMQLKSANKKISELEIFHETRHAGRSYIAVAALPDYMACMDKADYIPLPVFPDIEHWWEEHASADPNHLQLDQADVAADEGAGPESGEPSTHADILDKLAALKEGDKTNDQWRAAIDKLIADARTAAEQTEGKMDIDSKSPSSPSFSDTQPDSLFSLGSPIVDSQLPEPIGDGSSVVVSEEPKATGAQTSQDVALENQPVTIAQSEQDIAPQDFSMVPAGDPESSNTQPDALDSRSLLDSLKEPVGADGRSSLAASEEANSVDGTLTLRQRITRSFASKAGSKSGSKKSRRKKSGI